MRAGVITRRMGPAVAVDSDPRTPLYHRIYLALRAKILEGEYALRDRLPGERELQETYGVSRITAIRALNELEADGLVVRERGRGTRVMFTPNASVDAPNRETDPGNDGGATAEMLDFHYAEATPEVVEALALKPGDIIQRAVRVWSFQGTPFNHVMTAAPQDIGQLWSRADLQAMPLYAVLERVGIEVTQIKERVTATLAEPVLAGRLKVAAGSPILKIRRTFLSRARRPVALMTASYPPGRSHETSVHPALQAAGPR